MKTIWLHICFCIKTDLHPVSSSWSRWRRGALWSRHMIHSWSQASCRPLWPADPHRWTERSHWTSLDTLLAHSGSVSLPPYSPPLKQHREDFKPARYISYIQITLKHVNTSHSISTSHVFPFLSLGSSSFCTCTVFSMYRVMNTNAQIQNVIKYTNLSPLYNKYLYTQ